MTCTVSCILVWAMTAWRGTALMTPWNPAIMRTRSSNYPSLAVGGVRSRRKRETSFEDDPFGDFGQDGDSWEDTIGPATTIEYGESTTSAEGQTSHFFSRKELSDPSFCSNRKLFDLLCQGSGIQRPSKIQALAWPALLEGKHTVVADQSGAGKTLAYLIPLLQRALETIARDKDRRFGAPRILVMAPTAELADQIKAVCDKLGTTIPFQSMVITATGQYATSIRDQMRVLQRQPVDVMISTPGRLATILRTRNCGLDLTSLQSIVLDEVDVLLIDDTFGTQLRTVGVAAPVDRTQFVFCTATLPDSVLDTISKEFPGVVKVRGPGLHRVAPTVEEHLVDVSVPSQYNRDKQMCFDLKAKQLLKALRLHKCRRTLVFCNTVDSCRTVENLLNRKDRRGQAYGVGSYHSAMTPETRNQNLQVFANGKSDVDYILVCTDRAARGIDFDTASVDHVVLFDFPKDPAEYIRRVGRVARAGRKGTSTVFAYGWQLPIARKIMGKKLDSFTIAAQDAEEDENEEYKGGVQGRRKRQRSMKADKESVIKGNIESGRLWKK